MIIKRIGLLALFSIVGAMVMYLYYSAELGGFFEKWEPLGQPPGRVVKLIGLRYVQTKSGDIYQYTSELNCIDNCWLKVDTASDLHTEFQLPINACVDLPSVKNYVDSVAICERWGNGKSLTVDALDQNGEVFSWQHRFMAPYLYDFILPCVGAIIGFIMGFFVLLYSWAWKLRYKIESKKE